MPSRPPSPEELVDLSWLLDSALGLGERARTIKVADRLLEALVRHDEAMLVSRRHIDPTRAAALQDACLVLSADVVSVLTELRRGDVRRPVEFRGRVQQLVNEEAVALPEPMINDRRRRG